MHVDVDEVGPGAAVGLPVAFGILVSQFVSSMVIGRHVHLLPALVLLQLNAGTCKQHQLDQFTSPDLTNRDLEQTLAEIPEEHIKKGDVDWLMAAAMLLNLTQHHLTGNRKHNRFHKSFPYFENQTVE